MSDQFFAKQQPKYLSYGDILRVTGAFSVVVIHVTAWFVVNQDKISAASWWLANVLDSASRWCVPVFVMLSGALLLDPSKKTSYVSFYQKRLWRVGIPFVVFVLFFLLVRGIAHPEAQNFNFWMISTLSGTPYYHLHFLYIIVGLYAFTPLFQRFVVACSQRELFFASAACIVISCGAMLLSRKLGTYSPGNALTRFVPYIGYYLLGYSLRQMTFSKKASRYAQAAFILSLILTSVVSGYYINRKVPANNALFLYDFLSPTVIVMSISVWVIAASSSNASLLANKTIKMLAATSFGIYLIHPVFIGLIHTVGVITPYPLFSLLLWPMIIFFGSAAAVGLVQKTPMRIIFGEARKPIFRKDTGSRANLPAENT